MGELSTLFGCEFFTPGACKGHRTPYCIFGTPSYLWNYQS